MSKTIKQIADELGVTKQAVHQKRKTKSLSTALQPFTSTVDGVVYISVDGEKLIKSAFSKNDRKQVYVNEPSTVDGSFTVLLNNTIETLQQQLKVKDKQIEDLQNQNKELTDIVKEHAKSISAERQKELACKFIEGQQLLDNSADLDERKVPIKKQNLISRLFRKG